MATSFAQGRHRFETLQALKSRATLPFNFNLQCNFNKSPYLHDLRHLVNPGSCCVRGGVPGVAPRAPGGERGRGGRAGLLLCTAGTWHEASGMICCSWSMGFCINCYTHSLGGLHYLPGYYVIKTCNKNTHSR